MSACIRFRPRITKKKTFLLPSARIRLMTISEKNSQFLEIKKHLQKKSLFQEIIKTFFQLFLLVFSWPSLTFLKISQKFFFDLVALINFFRNLSNVFSILSPFF